MATFESHLYDKQYITFREFMSYFKEFKTAEDRYHQEKYGNNQPTYLSQAIPKIEESDEEKLILEKVNRLREEDKIDTDQEHIDLIQDIYDSIPRVQGLEAIYKIEFFLTIRKDPQIRKLLTTIAREPDGKSRIQRETFQEVFNRMEKYELADTIAWPTILEYFTKRGRPLTQEEKLELLEQDKQQDKQQKQKEEDERQEEEQFYDSLRKSKSGSSVQSDDPLAGNEYKPSFGQRDNSNPRGVRFESDTKFKDSLNDRDFNNPGTMLRNRSSEREDLSQIELRNQDFKEYNKAFKKRSRSTTKDYKITVPKTFTFEKRAEMRPKTIREWKMQKMIEEKKLEESMSHQHFKAARPPPEVLIPQYKNIVEKEKRRREDIKSTSKAKTKANEKLFNFYKREERKKQLKDEIKSQEKQFKHTFKARNVPVECATEVMKDPQTEKFIREERIKERAKKLYEESKLPPNMNKNEEKMNKRKEERMKALEKELFEFDRRPKRRDKPNFKKLHEDFSTQLESKKREHKPVKVDPFKLTEPKEKLPKIEDVEGDNQFMKLMVGAVIKTNKKPVPVPTTKKMNQVLEKRQQEEQELENNKAEERKLKEEKKKQTL